jgi:hypothetical protein
MVERMKFYECRGCKGVWKETEINAVEIPGTEGLLSVPACPRCKSEDLEAIE